MLDSRLWTLITLFLLTGCIVQSRVQGRYIDAQEECRDQAESAVASRPDVASLTPDQQSLELVNQFSVCMNKAHWPVANPLKSKTAAVTDAPKPSAQQTVGPSSVKPTSGATAVTVPVPPAPGSSSVVEAPAHYERATDQPAATPAEAAAGRQF